MGTCTVVWVRVVTGFGPSPPLLYPKIVVYTSPDLQAWTFRGFALSDWPTKPYGTFFTPWTVYVPGKARWHPHAPTHTTTLLTKADVVCPDVSQIQQGDGYVRHVVQRVPQRLLQR